jgi:hypothetical protein
MPSGADYHDPEEDRQQQDTLRVENEALRRGFTLIPNYVLRARGISRDAKLLYGILLSYAWQKGNCWPGYDTLMEDVQCGRPQLAKYIKELKDTGLIHVQRRGQGLTSIYTIKDVRPENIQKFQNETSRSSRAKPPVVSKRNGEENKDEEYPVEEYEAISKERNSNLFHSNHTYAQLSTTLRRPRTVDKPGAAPPGDGDPEPTAAPTGWSKLAQVAEGLAQRLPDQRRQPGSPPAPSGSGRGRPPKAPPYLAATIEEITHRLNDDPTHVRSNTTRATKLWKYSGLPEDKFVTSVLYQARSLAQQQGNVTKRAAAGAGGPINRVPYFFAVVEDLLGLKDTAGNPA